MSLRIFHMVFIVASILLSTFVAVWAVRHYMATGDGATIAVGGMFVVLASVLVVYSFRVFEKLKELA